MSYLIGLAIVVAMVAYVVRQDDLVAGLKAISAGTLAVLLTAEIAISLIHGGQFRRMSRVFGADMSYPDGLGLTVTGTMLNYVIPLKGGMVMRAAYMKHRYGMSYAGYGALLASSQLLSVAATAIAGLGLSAAAVSLGHRASWVLAAAFALALAGSLLAYRLVEVIDFSRIRPELIGRHLARFATGFGHWRRNPRTGVWYALSLMLVVVISGFRLNVLLAALGVSAPVLSVYLVSAAVAVSNTLPITPGNLGVTEATMVLAAGLVGIDTQVALLAGLVERAVALIVLIVLGIPFSQLLVPGVRKKRDADVSG